jgi:transposase-like protein
MARGRPPLGVQLLDTLPAPRGAQRRLRVVLATLTGAQTVADACLALGIGRSRFHTLRQQVLRGALDAVSGRPRGRPRRVVEDPPDVRVLRTRIRELELALRATQLRSEIALTMPFLLDRARRKKKGRNQPRASGPHSRGARGARARRRP